MQRSFLSFRWLAVVFWGSLVLAPAAVAQTATITSLTPASAIAGSASFTLTIHGTNFTSTSISTWGTTALPIIYESATELKATIPASLIATAGVVSVTVRTLGGVSSGATFAINPPLAITSPSPVTTIAKGLTFAINPPPPVFTSKTLDSAVSSGADYSPARNGIRHTTASIAELNTTPLLTTDKNAIQPTTAAATLVPAANIARVTIGAFSGTSFDTPLPATSAAPKITSLSPNSAYAGGAGFTLTINGTNFTSASTLKWGARSLSTTYVSSIKLTAAVPASLIATAGAISVTVSTVSGTSSGAAFTINPALPTITSLSPTTAVNGGAGFTLTINGSNFSPGYSATLVEWNYTVLPTTYVTSTQVTAAVPASLIAGVGTASIWVITAAGISSSLSFTISPAMPVITGLIPKQIPAGNSTFQLTIQGTYFTSTATVYWGSTPLVTTYNFSKQITAMVPASLVASASTANVTVTTAGGRSAPSTFTTYLVPNITSLSPASAPAGGAAFTLLVNGTNFTPGEAVLWESKTLNGAYVSATQFAVTVPSSLIATIGTASVTVIDSQGHKASLALFIITPAPPAITSLSPSSVTAGSAGFMLTVNGTAFTPDATVIWGTTRMDTIYVSPTQLKASEFAAQTEFAGTSSITVATTAGKSAPAIFTINPAPPVIGGLNPCLATAGGATYAMTVYGNNFTPTTVVKWLSTALTTSYVSSTQLTATVPATLITTAGTAGITVTTALGTSASVPVTINPAINFITTTLPAATAGNAYSGPIHVTGGSPGYNWTVTGLPASMSINNTSGSTLTITGTPTSPGTITFQVSVQDIVGGAAGPVTYTINIAAGVDGAKISSLNGRYVCLFQGSIDYDSTRWATVASFQADGQGNFTNGLFDTNSHAIGSASGIMTGSYNIGSDNNGVASIHTVLTDGAAGIQTTQWTVAISSATQPARQFRMVEADDLGTLPSYQQGAANCFLASPSAFYSSTISGNSFVFGLDGEDNRGNMKAAVGRFSASGGHNISGNIDSARGGSSTVQSTVITGTFTAPDPATGRFMILLKGGGNPTGFAVYIIDANRMFILDNTSNDGEQVGNMRAQQQASTSGTTLGGPFVFYLRGAEFNSSGSTPSSYYSSLFQGTGDGAGNMTFNQSYTNGNGAYAAGRAIGGPIALTFDSAHPGRATFTSASGTTYLYLFNTSSAIEMSVQDNGSLDSGWLEPQTQIAFTSTALAGNYLFGELPQLNGESDGNVGEYGLTSSGVINASVTTAGEDALFWDQSMSMNYAWDTMAPGTGTFLIANNAQGGASCAVINATKFACIPQTDSSPSVQIMQQ